MTLDSLLFVLLSAAIHVGWNCLIKTSQDPSVFSLLKGMTMASYSLILHVLQSTPVSYVVSVRQSSVLLAVFVGWIQLKEPYGKFRLATSILMVIGLYLVVTATV